MGTANQVIWSATSGLYMVPRSSETTVKQSTFVQTTGATIFNGEFKREPKVSADEQEWASLLSLERKRLVKKRVKAGAVNKAIREVRYGR